MVQWIRFFNSDSKINPFTASKAIRITYALFYSNHGGKKIYEIIKKYEKL